METDRPQTKRGQIVFVGSKGSGKSSLYQCLKSPNQHVSDVPSCSVVVEEWKPFDAESSSGKIALIRISPGCYNVLYTCKKTHRLFLPVDRLEHGSAGQLEHGY